MKPQYDYLVIGSGLAGLTFALQAAAHGSVAVVTKKNRTDANSSWAQGGIAGVLGEDDSVELHKQDTLVAGAGLCNEAAVDVLVREGPLRIRDLIEMGAEFDLVTDETGLEVLSLGREGGHSRNRIVHTADYTGWECERTLLEAVRRQAGIEVLEHLFVTDLAVTDTGEGPLCTGAHVLDVSTGERSAIRARATLLATGGCGQVYQHTTNPNIASGDGVAMAWRAGAVISNMEFIQFHPTTLFHPEARSFLITEALRGEGGYLIHKNGERFMERYHPLKELAPRDIVARAIVSEMDRASAECVYLDVRHIDADELRAHFPTVYERCLGVGIDITQQPIPIVPAHHYQCGGVRTDLDGSTGIPGLYAAGEVACTGVHGANRLASNSLLEALVFGWRAARHAVAEGRDIPPADRLPVRARLMDAATHPDRARMKRTLQRSAGIVRTTEQMLRGRRELDEWKFAAAPEQWTAEEHETLNIAQVGWLILDSALRRHESRGLHYSLDFPQPVEAERHDTVLPAIDMAIAE